MNLYEYTKHSSEVRGMHEGYPAALELRKIYRTLPDEKAEKHSLLRVVDESAEDYLYPERLFVPIPLPRAAEEAFLHEP